MGKNFSKKFKITKLKLFEFDHWIVSVSPKQITVGSLIISLKRNCFTLENLHEDEAKELSKVFNLIERILKSSLDADEINYLILRLEDKQIHFYAIPRYQKTVTLNNKKYIDKYWPQLINTNSFIDENGIEFDVLSYLKNSNIEQKEKKIIGYTTGVFDLFHIGHLNILRRAKEECDYLIVGVTTDELAFKLKNKKPIIPFNERCEIIKHINCVDKVIPQNEINELNDYERLKFNKIFKGSDWQNTEKWNKLENIFKQKGVKVIYFPYTQNTSSSMIRKILEDKIIEK